MMTKEVSDLTFQAMDAIPQMIKALGVERAAERSACIGDLLQEAERDDINQHQTAEICVSVRILLRPYV